MEKKYQVFVSSTYQDLIEERQKVIEALIGKNCFPVGMEYFPAANDDQFTVIKKLIDGCDYYILIIGGWYGSIEPKTGKSYTQLEFEYAVSKGIPVASFYHAEPNKLIGDRIEPTDEGKRKLDEFKKMVQTRLCKPWVEPYELAFKVGNSLDYLFENNPRTGWVKADEISSADANKEILRLKQENERFLRKVEQLEPNGPEDIEDLEHGDDEFTILYGVFNSTLDFRIVLTWDEIFKKLSDSLLLPKSMTQIVDILHEKLNISHAYEINKEDVRTILIQLMSLNLIETDSLKDGLNSDWVLTTYGQKEMIRLKVRRRK